LRRRQFEELVREALDALPREFAERIENVEVIVEDWPTRGQLEETGVPPGQTLLGLYVGTPVPERAKGYFGVLPDIIYLFQRPIEEVCRTEEEIVQEIRATVIHEVGHYFGLSEEDIEQAMDR